MIREASITQEQVNAAANALRAAGAKVTVRAVRKELGDVGSQSTVMRMLADWKSEQVQVPEAPMALPAPLQRVLADYLAKLITEGKVELSAEVAELQQVNGDLGIENERLISQLEAVQAENAALQSERDAYAGRVQQLEADLGVSRAETEHERNAAASVRTDLAKSQLRLEAVPGLEEELKAARAEAAKERGDRVIAEQKAAVAAARLEGAERERERIESALREASAREEQANVQVNELTAQLVDGRLVRARGEREGRKLVDLRRAVGPVSPERKAGSEKRSVARGKPTPDASGTP
ncbi:FtsZ-binding cell division protein ZapB [Cupriavidus metallidurans]|jgi:FtsZ-binding cell division protein ZapB|uniref:DNA-binding protein n=1 Tax=Cupriavidus TaxID=106589 RepID=UPI0004930A1F|nr:MULTISPECIES: DNA-binding protein [Cupriavidus]KAB0597111.1 mucin-associated surface protein [Cupriavidus pauculus]MCA3187391.1 DNA-binding protein [Cupriavidus sp.]MCA3194017.1 DNA-binding protein [Cupriavidus sp.]MCA3198446.1 DNA-binding protein [Cupriavidus sp.]MCA3232207.1 DNA-binding protein [Cupriavidus sp.]